MVELRAANGAIVNVEKLGEALQVQKSIGLVLMELRHKLRGADPIEARAAADSCNNLLRIAQANEKAMISLRNQNYIDLTSDSVDDFVSELGLEARDN